MAPKDQVDSMSYGDSEEKDPPTEKVVSKRSESLEQAKSNDAVLEDVQDASDEELVAVPLEASSKRMNKTKTVKDLRNDFDKFASTSSLTLADHVSSATKAKSQVTNGKLNMFFQFPIREKTNQNSGKTTSSQSEQETSISCSFCRGRFNMGIFLTLRFCVEALIYNLYFMGNHIHLHLFNQSIAQEVIIFSLKV